MKNLSPKLVAIVAFSQASGLMLMPATAQGVTSSPAEPPATQPVTTVTEPAANRTATPGGVPKPGEVPNVRQLTPEQREQILQQVRAQTREDGLRQMLTTAGFTDPKLQDAILAFIATEQQDSRRYREQGRKLIEAWRSKTLTPGQLSMVLNDFRTAAEDEKQRRAAAQTALDEKIVYSKNPRLEIYLRLLGLVGDEASLLVTGANSLGGATIPGGATSLGGGAAR